MGFATIALGQAVLIRCTVLCRRLGCVCAVTGGLLCTKCSSLRRYLRSSQRTRSSSAFMVFSLLFMSDSLRESQRR